MKYISDLNSLPPNLRILIRRNHAHEDKLPKTLKSKQPKLTVSLKLHHTAAKSQKHETIQTFSKKFIKSPALNSTTTLGAAVSKTVVGTTINLTATTINVLFPTGITQLSTSLTVIGRDSGARVTIPITVTKTSA